jgi:L-aspartate oxidase
MSDYRYDFLVIGSGLAGLVYALEVACWGRVAILTKREAAESSTRLAQGGIATVSDPEDTFAAHGADTVAAGAGLGTESLVQGVVEEGPEAIETLEGHGVTFARVPSGEAYDLGREGGHSHRRILHATDETGRVIEEALLARVREHPQIDLYPHHCAIDLITTAKLEGSIPEAGLTVALGVYALDAAGGEIRVFLAPHTLLASGGCGKVYRYTSNPDVATGDGLAMAYRAGARLANLEFVQFHPTCLYDPRGGRFLLSEALRGEGAILKSISGEAFMDAYHPMGSLAARDVVARACDQEMKRRGDRHVMLDLSAIGRERVKRRFPMIYASCLEMGIDIARDPVPVVPAAHYLCGGVVTDGDGRTDLVGLYAAGETACTGLHGANRLASNSLLEAAVFALRAARASGARGAAGRTHVAWHGAVPPWDPGTATVGKESVLVDAHWQMVRALMWDFVGIVRTDHRLSLASRYIALMRESIDQYYWDFILDSDLIELRNIAVVAELIIRAAASRRESRGLHHNADHPARDDRNWQCDTLIDPIHDEVRPAATDELPFGRRQGAWRVH